MESTINLIAEKLAVPVEKLLNTIPALGIVYVLYFACVTILLLIIGIVTLSVYKHRDRYKWFDSTMLLGLLPFVCLLLLWVKLGGSVLLWLYNPSAWALNYIITAIK